MNKELIKQINKLTQVAYQLNYEYEMVEITEKNKHLYLKDLNEQDKKNISIILHRDINTKNTKIYAETMYNSIKNAYKNIKLARYENRLMDVSEFIKTYRYIQYLFKAKNSIHYAEQIINRK